MCLVVLRNKIVALNIYFACTVTYDVPEYFQGVCTRYFEGVELA